MMKKTEMATFVKENKKKVSKKLQDMIEYTLKMYKEDVKSVTAQDFRSLVSDIKAEISSPTPTASAASVKKDTKEKAEKKVTKKKTKKKSESGVDKVETVGGAIDIAKAFKEEIETPLGVIAKDDSIKNIKDVAKILESGEKEVLCAVYWTERLLEQFPYTSLPGLTKPKAFDNDLDLVSIIFVSPDNKIMVGVSSYTFVPYVFCSDDMKQTKGLRYSNGAEFNVYTLDVTD